MRVGAPFDAAVVLSTRVFDFTPFPGTDAVMRLIGSGKRATNGMRFEHRCLLRCTPHCNKVAHIDACDGATSWYVLSYAGYHQFALFGVAFDANVILNEAFL